MKSIEILNLPLDQLVTAPQVRTRFDEELLAGLTASLKEVGLQQPIRVRRAGDKWTPIDGARRVLAARAAGWRTIPAIVEEQELTEAEVVQRQIICAVLTADLTDIEKARAIERLIRLGGYTAAQVAQKTGLSEATVSRLRALLALPADVQERIHMGRLSSSTGYAIAKLKNPDERAALLARAASGGLTRDEASRRSLVRRGDKRPRKPRQRPSANLKRIVLMLGGERSFSVAGPGMTLPALIAWVEELRSRLLSLSAIDMALIDAVKAFNNQQQ